jgi:hypothetical protein
MTEAEAIELVSKRGVARARGLGDGCGNRGRGAAIRRSYRVLTR